tara:strand:+ start:142 stop:294 length:153 start_codon:yes stop_codon:yes gene_type:complete
MDRTIVSDKIADYVVNDEYADSHIFCDFEGEENTRQIYTIRNMAKATTRE